MLHPAHLLRNDRLASILTANPVRLAIAICAAWILPGLVGHDPWKPDEAHTFGIVYQLLQSHDWVVPNLAGEPFLEHAPLMYLSAALFGVLFSPFLPLHDAARLASGAYMALTFLLVGLAAKELYGNNRSWVAALMLLGCGGVLLRAHQLIADVALLAGMALALYGLALSIRRPRLAGLWLGVGLGVIAYSSGLVELLMLLLLVLALPAVSAHWRTRAYLATAAIGLLVMLPWALLWPAALHARSPDLFEQWLWVENVLRFRNMVSLNPGDQHFYYLNILPWFAWPALPFAVWTLWREGRAGLRTPQIILPLACFTIFLLFLSMLGEARDVYALPLLLPLALLAASGFDKLQRGAANAFYWFAIMLFTFLAVVGWFYWMAIDLGVPQRLHQHMMRLQPEYSMGAHPLAIALAAFITAAWFVLLFNIKRNPERPILVWAAGVTTIWSLVAMLLVNYIDTGKTYRAMVAQLTAALPASHGCIYSESLGQPQRAMLFYFGNVTTERLERNGPRPACDLLITQDNWKNPGEVGGDWKMIWQGRRPGDKQERYRLYQKAETGE